jgi:hypothetical protein
MDGAQGRNELCRCGSGKKYKKCHLPVDEALTRGGSRGAPPEVVAQLRAHVDRENERQRQYGDVRAIIHTDFQGHKFVAVGSMLHWGHWRFFTDFLQYFIKTTFGAEWGNAELQKPLAERHVILQWYHAFSEFQARHPLGADGIASGVPDGPSFAYLTLAYDLYLLGDHQQLRQRLVERLKRADEFQGARYELYVGAVMIRAGFDLKAENDRDSSRQHGEYRARHRRTSEEFVVEAKSRHLPGVLGYAGERQPLEDFTLDIRGPLRRALDKRLGLPYIVFIDANMPPEYADSKREEWVTNVNRAVEWIDHGWGDTGLTEGSALNFLAVTNVPHHYGLLGAEIPSPVFYRVIPSNPKLSVRDISVFLDVERSLQQSHNVPGEFSDSQ